MSKVIEFETIQEICLHKNENLECDEENNYSGECNCSECPVWNDLINGEVEL